MRTPRRTAHLTTRAVLDYLEGRADAADRRRLEEHVAGPCPECRALLRETGWVVELMQSDRLPDVPEALRRRALEVFAPSPAPAATRQSAWIVARLLFDSLTAELPAAVRRTVGEARGLRYALGGDSLELEVELEEPGVLTLRGRLAAPEPGQYRIDVAAGDERFSAWPDAAGIFAIERVPPGAATVTLAGPSGRYRLPELML